MEESALIVVVAAIFLWGVVSALLFSDAARVRVEDLRGDVGVVLRLLGLGLPLTVLAGWGLALWLLPAVGVWLALLVGAALAPTDQRPA